MMKAERIATGVGSINPLLYVIVRDVRDHPFLFLHPCGKESTCCNGKGKSGAGGRGEKV